nr:hypothetical protein [Tanacetum cinerariifolium]
MSLDDLYNHLKVYESEVQKKLDPNSQNMAFISSSKHNSGNEDGFDKSKVECFNYHKMGHFARECRAPRSQERGRKENYRQGSEAEENTPKALMAIDGGSKAKEQASKALMTIDGVGWDWSYMVNDEEDHALVADEVTPIEFALIANISAESKKLKTLKEEKEGVDGKLAGLLTALKDLNNLIESQRPSLTVESTSGDDQNRNPSVSETDRATIAKSSSLPHDSSPRVTSPVAAEGSMQPNINELTALCTSLQRQSRDDAPIKGRSIDEGEAAAEMISDDSKELARVLTSMDASIVLVGGIDVPTGSGSIPTAGPPATDIHTGSDAVPTASPIITTGSDAVPTASLIVVTATIVEDFIPMGSKEESERYKRKGIRFDQESSKKLKSSEEVIKDAKSTEEIPEEKMKDMM